MPGSSIVFGALNIPWQMSDTSGGTADTSGAYGLWLEHRQIGLTRSTGPSSRYVRSFPRPR